LEAGIDDPEQKCPATKLTPSETNLLATATACFGSQASSPMLNTSFWPSTPPLALRSLTAISAPRCICSPNEAYCPVMGPAVLILISACAAPAERAIAAAAIIAYLNVFMWLDLPAIFALRRVPRRCAAANATEGHKATTIEALS
jgi:hypothetical protein